MMHCILIRASLKINVFKVLFWERGRGSQPLLILLTIMDDPLHTNAFNIDLSNMATGEWDVFKASVAHIEYMSAEITHSAQHSCGFII